ncbi:MAG: molybdopterin-dependent oxidoreductase [Bacillota bacterium]|jgi:DMSO/TMAO reductase YedYZ molybdopterin-dependent catalytic subunit
MKRGLSLTILLLVAAIAVTAFLNRQDIADRRELQADAAFLILREDQTIKLDMEMLQELPSEEFVVTLRSSSAADRDHTYRGVELRVLLREQGLNLESTQTVTVKAVDGYAVVLSGEEALLEENVYLTYLRDGKPLGTKADGGSGPFQLVIRRDTFAQRWCKFVSEIVIK